MVIRYPRYNVILIAIPDLVGEVGNTPDGSLEGRRVHVVGHGDDDLNVVGDGPRLELALGLKEKTDLRHEFTGKETENNGFRTLYYRS